MNFMDTLYITIIDNFVIGAFLVWLAFFLNRRLEKFKKEQEFKHQVALSRINAYLKLWSLTSSMSPSIEEELNNEDIDSLSIRLRLWYYEDGNGVYLPIETAKLFLDAKDKLNADSGRNPLEIKSAFSKLRTQMKVDVGVYNVEHATIKIGR